MKHQIKSSIRLLSSFLALLFVFYVYPAWAIAAEPAVTEAIIMDEPEGEPITEEEHESFREYYDEEYSEPDVIGEVDSLRDLSVKHYRMSDGTFRAVDYGKDVHFKDESDEWTDYDNDLVLNETLDPEESDDFVGFEPEKNDASIKFAKNTSTSNLLKIKYKDFKISFGLRDANKSTPVIENGDLDPDDKYAVPGITSKITYPSVFDGVDLVYILDGSNVKEYFVVSEDADVFEYTFDIKVKNVTPSVNENGDVIFTKEDGSIAYTIPKGYMYDSATGHTDNVTYTVEHVKNKKYTLTITADKEWITAEGRVYPVMIDPTVVLNKYANGSELDYGKIETSYKDMVGGTVRSNTDHIYIGISGSENFNAHLKVVDPNSLLPDNTILCNASFLIYQLAGDDGFSQNNLNRLYIGAYRAASESDPYTTTSSLLDYMDYYTSSTGRFTQIDVTPVAREWYTGSANNGVVLTALNNTSTSYANVRLYGCYSANAANAYQPRYIVSYRHTVGIEGYYTYENVSVGRAGTLYVNANTGQSVVINDIITTNNLAVPYTVSLVYNSVYTGINFSNNPGKGIHTADYTKMKIGSGWKLNSQMSVTEVTLESFIPGNSATYLVFCDGDGTEHYFAQSSDNASIYKDEDGLGLQIEVLSNISLGKYKMTDDKDNVTMFSDAGYILNSKDANGNSITYNYDSAGNMRQLRSISVYTYGGATKTVASFTYDTNNYLTSITDQYGRVTTLGYNTSSPKELESVTFPDGNSATYSCALYSGFNNTEGKLSNITDNESGYSSYILYEADGNKIRELHEYISLSESTLTYGSRLAFTYYGSERTMIRYSGNDGDLNTSDDTANVYHFDYWGRCTNIHTLNPDTLKVYGSTSAAYTSHDTETSKKRNRIESSSTTGIQPVNMLVNAGAELKHSTTNIPSWFYKPTLSTGQTVQRTTAKSHTGVASIEVSATTAPSSGLHTYYVFSGLSVGYTYTFSAYAKAVNFNTTSTSGGYYLRVGSNYSVRLNKSSDTTSDDGWVKLSVTFNATTSGSTYLYAGFAGATGTVYFDDFQLALGDDTDQISLISDGGFEHTNTDNWTNNGVSDSTIAEYDWNISAGNFNENYRVSGTRSLQIYGSPTSSKCASIVVPINKSGANTYVYSGWAYAISVPLEKGDKYNKPTFCLSAMIVYTDNTSEWCSKSFSADYKSWWQFASVPIVPTKTNKMVSYIKLFAAYDYNGNDVVFDSFSLVADNATCYEYDDNGNVTAANSTKTSEINATYSGADLTSYTAVNGADYTYEYDSKHNVESASWAGVTNELTYNSAGLPTSSKLSNNVNSQYIKTSATYDSYGKLTSETDQLGNTTTYDYAGNGALAHTNYPNYTGVSYVTNSENNRLTNIHQYYKPNPSSNPTYHSDIALDYDKGRLSSLTVGTSSKNETYNFTYNSYGDMTSLSVGGITLSNNTYNRFTGALVTSVSPSGYTQGYTYDNLGRLTGVTSNGTAFKTQEYNASGNLHQSTDHPFNLITSYLYDSIGRTTGVIQRNTSNVFKQMTSYVFDNANRLNKRYYDLDFYDNRISEIYTYDDNGLLTELKTTKGSIIEPEYNNLNQIDRVKISHNDVYYKDYVYKEVENQANRTTNLPNTLSYYESASSPLLTFNYNYDTINRVTSVTQSGSGTTNYTYDNYGKLTGVTKGSDTYSYTYDYLGNITRINKTVGGTTTTKKLEYDSNWKDRLMSVNGKALEYDSTAPGLPTKYQNGEKTLTMAWSEQGNLELVMKSGTVKKTSYGYYSNGLRGYKITTDGVRHDYYYDGDRLIAETFGDKYFLFNYDENDSIFSVTYYDGTSPYTYQLIKNLQGDVIEIWNAVNGLCATYEYDAWGNVVSIKDGYGNDITNSTGYFANFNPIRYRSYYYDTETGFYYLKSRYYDPAIGRFISADTMMSPNPEGYGLNLFAYCGNDPVNKSDSDGNWPKLSTICKVVTVIAAVVAVAAVCVATAGLGTVAVAGGGTMLVASATTTTALGVAASAGKLAIVAAGAAAVSEDAEKKYDNLPKNHTVYGLQNTSTGQIEYVGRTTDPVKREAAHKRNPARAHLEMVPLATGLNAIEARGVEQIQMLAHHTINTTNKMNNQINGISPSNRNLGVYMEAGRGVLIYLGNQISNDILYWTGN